MSLRKAATTRVPDPYDRHRPHDRLHLSRLAGQPGTEGDEQPQPGRLARRQLADQTVQIDKVTSNDATSRMLGGYDPNFVHFPSETTSTEPSTTLMAVCSSMA